MKPVNTVTKTFLIMLIVGFLLWCAVALFMAGRYSRPIQEILRVISTVTDSEPSGARNEFDFIRGTIANLVQRNEGMAADLSRQASLIENTFFERLLQNHFVDRDEMAHHMAHAKVTLAGQWQQVMLVKINGYYGRMTRDMLDEMESVRVLVRSLLAKHLEDIGYFYQVSEDSIAAVISAEEDFDARQAARQVLEEFESYKIVASFGIGTRYPLPTELWQSFNEAKKALNNAVASSGIYVYEQYSRPSDGYVYPMQTEIRLINLVKSGEKDGTIRLLDDLEANNFQKHNLLPEKARLLVSELIGAASHFNLVEKYFSRFFKEQTGENFSTCLEKIRMEKSRQLLDNSDLPLSEIARQTGYLNMNTFYKAFRRTFGVSPSDYRKNQE